MQKANPATSRKLRRLPFKLCKAKYFQPQNMSTSNMFPKRSHFLAVFSGLVNPNLGILSHNLMKICKFFHLYHGNDPQGWVLSQCTHLCHRIFWGKSFSTRACHPATRTVGHAHAFFVRHLWWEHLPNDGLWLFFPLLYANEELESHRTRMHPQYLFRYKFSTNTMWFLLA